MWISNCLLVLVSILIKIKLRHQKLEKKIMIFFVLEFIFYSLQYVVKYLATAKNVSEY